MGASCSCSKNTSIPDFHFQDPDVKQSIDIAKNGYTLTLRNADLLEVTNIMPYFGHLQQLNLRRCFLKDEDYVIIPRNFASLKRLINLELIGMDLGHRLTPELFTPFLESMLIEHCCLTKLPPLLSLRSLKVMDISNNNLSSLPDDISTLKFLEVLDISSNFFLSYPENLKNLPRLEGLDLRNNQLTKLNFKCLATFPKLSSLIASDNRLTEFAPNVVPPKLSKIDLAFNRIKYFNKELMSVEELNWVDFTGNPFEYEHIEPGKFKKDQLNEIFNNPKLLSSICQPEPLPNDSDLPTKLCHSALVNDLSMISFKDLDKKFLSSSLTQPSIHFNSFSPLHVCCISDKPTILSKFLTFKPNTNPIANGFTPLMLACRSGSLECVKILVKNGVNHKASPHIPRADASETVFGCIKVPRLPSPLSIACESGHRIIVKYLIEKGADPRPLLDKFNLKVPGTQSLFNDPVLKRFVESLAKYRSRISADKEQKWHNIVATTLLVNLAVSKFKKCLVVAKARKKAIENGEIFDESRFKRSLSL
ncbi:hypothetical protein P9112_002254 [Eukaryota sp. TZLM1-RC]